MRLLIQRVTQAQVSVNEQVQGTINQGLVVLLGITHSDSRVTADYLLNKLINLRIFDDVNAKLNLAVKDIGGEILVVSQFTLYGNSEKGNRPSFIAAAKPEAALALYQYFVEQLRLTGLKVATGVFGATMQINLVNDGPVTMLLEK